MKNMKPLGNLPRSSEITSDSYALNANGLDNAHVFGKIISNSLGCFSEPFCAGYNVTSGRVVSSFKDAPRGPIVLDEYANPIENVYIRKAEKKMEQR